MVQDSAASSYTICLPFKSLLRALFLKGPQILKGIFPLPLFTGLGCSRFARRYYGNRVCFLFLRLLRCFNSPGCLFPTYEFCRKFLRLPYSGIFGSKLVASSPKRIAGICALHRLWVPRSPP
jgi:hypothetical protein